MESTVNTSQTNQFRSFSPTAQNDPRTRSPYEETQGVSGNEQGRLASIDSPGLFFDQSNNQTQGNQINTASLSQEEDLSSQEEDLDSQEEVLSTQEEALTIETVKLMTLPDIVTTLKGRISQSHVSIYNCGKMLLEAKAKLKENDQSYLEWLKENITFAEEKTARRFVLVALFVDKQVKKQSKNISDILSDLRSLDCSSLYLIAKSKTPQKVIDQVIKRACAGEKFNVAQIEALIKGHSSNSSEQSVVAPNSKTILKRFDTQISFLNRILENSPSFEQEENEKEILEQKLAEIEGICSKIKQKIFEPASNQELEDKGQ